MMATTLAEYLEDQSVGTVGTDIFVGLMRPNTVNQIVLIPTAGLAPNGTINLDIPGCQVLVRNSDWNTGYVKAQDVYRTLHKLTNTAVSGADTIQRCEAMGSPTYVGQDEEMNYIFSISFIVYMATATS